MRQSFFSVRVEDVKAAIWPDLGRAAVDKRHPFRYPVLGTLGLESAELRTIVLRDLDYAAKKLYFFTDSRSPKVEQLKQQDTASLLFYHHKRKVQLRIKGQCKRHHQNELSQQYLARLPEEQTRDYRSLRAPGAMPGPGGLIEDPTIHFMVLEIRVSAIDFLQLKAKGHQRFHLTYAASGQLLQCQAIQP